MRQKGFAPILILILLVALGAAGYFSYKTHSASKNVVSLSPLTPMPSAASTVVSTTGWKTYTNNEFGFELETPSEWKFAQSSDATGKLAPQFTGGPTDPSEKSSYQFILFTYDNSKHLTSKQYVDQLISNHPKDQPGGLIYDSREETSLNGIPATKLHNIFAYDENDEEVVLANSKNIYQFVFPVAKDNPNLLNPIQNYDISQKILSTFKFTN